MVHTQTTGPIAWRQSGDRRISYCSAEDLSSAGTSRIHLQPDAADRLNDESISTVLQRFLCRTTRSQFILLNQSSNGETHFQNRQPLTNAVSRSSGEREIKLLRHVFRSEPSLWSKDFWIGPLCLGTHPSEPMPNHDFCLSACDSPGSLCLRELCDRKSLEKCETLSDPPRQRPRDTRGPQCLKLALPNSGLNNSCSLSFAISFSTTPGEDTSNAKRNTSW